MLKQISRTSNDEYNKNPIMKYVNLLVSMIRFERISMPYESIVLPLNYTDIGE